MAYGPPAKKLKTENDDEANEMEQDQDSNGISAYSVVWVKQMYLFARSEFFLRSRDDPKNSIPMT